MCVTREKKNNKTNERTNKITAVLRIYIDQDINFKKPRLKNRSDKGSQKSRKISPFAAEKYRENKTELTYEHGI